jgi:phosphoglycolate phosphatase
MGTDILDGIDGILFDLDGTLADTFLDLRTAVNHVRGQRSLPPLPLDVVMSHVGRGVGSLVAGALQADDPVMIAQGIDAFRTYYAAHLLDETRAYPGAVDAVASLVGRRRAVLSNKPEAMTRSIVEGLGYRPYLDGAWGGDSFTVMKPDPAAILSVLAIMGVSPDRALMVGDSDVDIEAARRAGVRSALVRTGLWRASVMPPDVVVENLAELVNRLDSAAR